jgi:plastocyanin
MKTRVWLSALALAASVTTCAMADITGTVKLDGKAPEAKPIDTSSVPGCHHDKPIVDEKVVVGADNGLANVVVSIKKEEGQDLPGSDNPPKTPGVLDQKGCQYVPHVIAVQVGQPIVAKNSDPLLHNVHTQPEKNTPDNIAEPNVDEKGHKLKVPTDPEYYHVKCDVHPWMSAWIAVIDNPFFAVSDKDGKIDIPTKGLKDGKYTLHVWQEKYGEQDVPVEVKGGNATVNITVKQS